MNYKKLINTTGGVLIVILVVIIILAYSIIQDQKQTIEIQKPRPIMLYENTENTQEIGFRIFSLINIARETRGLPEFKYSPPLSKAATTTLKIY